MPTRSAEASWHGSLQQGHGNVRTESGTLEGVYSFPSRFEDGDGTNPEELMAASHAGCYAMAFSLLLGQQGYEVERIDATARVTIEEVDGAPTITRSELTTSGAVSGIDEAEFQRIADEAKSFCPVSRALAGTSISVEASLEN